MWPHRRQPTRPPCPWDFPGKNSGVGCHFLLQCMKVKGESEVAQSCPTLSDPMDCSLPGSSIHGIFRARVLEWGAIAFSKHTRTPDKLVVEIDGCPESIWSIPKLLWTLGTTRTLGGPWSLRKNFLQLISFILGTSLVGQWTKTLCFRCRGPGFNPQWGN